MFSLRLKPFNQHFCQLNNLLNSYIFLLWNAKFQRFAFFISRLIVLFAQNRSAMNDMDYMLTQIIRLKTPPTHTASQRATWYRSCVSGQLSPICAPQLDLWSAKGLSLIELRPFATNLCILYFPDSLRAKLYLFLTFCRSRAFSWNQARKILHSCYSDRVIF